jgi:enoyl-CoA hydratase/carnithine racemase
MSDIITERSGSILRVQFNRPAKKNAMTSSMYVAFADLLNDTEKDDRIRVVLWHGAGDSFCAGNDVEDFLKNPPGPGESPQAVLMSALINFEKPLIAAVHGAAIGGGTTMLTHCDFVYAGESAKFQMPFINLGLVPEFGTTCSVPARIGYLRATELILLALPFDAKRAAELGLVTRVVPDQKLLATATETIFTRAARTGDENRERRVQFTITLGGHQGSDDGISRKTVAGLHKDKGSGDGRIGVCGVVPRNQKPSSHAAV